MIKKRNPFSIGEGARRMIFCGVPVCILGVLVLIDSNEHVVSDKVWPYIFLAVAGIITAFGLVAYRIIPKRFILPLGIIGWLMSFLILFCNVK